MTELWFGPLDAERHWNDDRAASLPALSVEDSTAGMDEVLIALAGPHDTVLTQAPLHAQHAEHLAACLPYSIDLGTSQSDGLKRVLDDARGATPRPWAVVPAVIDAWPSWADAPPDLAVVRRVNSKLWSTQMRASSGPGAAIAVHGTAELDGVARTMLTGGAIVVKEAHGVSGRGTQAITSASRLERLIARLRRNEEHGQEVTLIVERMIDRAFDFSSHLEIARDRSWQWRGMCGLVNRGFAYAGSTPLSGAAAERLAGSAHREAIAAIAERIAAERYHGPVCVDGIIATDGTVHSIIEINARHSLGLACLRLGSRYQDRSYSVVLEMIRHAPTTGSIGRLLDALRTEQALPAGAGEPGAIILTATTASRTVIAIVHRDTADLAARRAAVRRGFERAAYGVYS